MENKRNTVFEIAGQVFSIMADKWEKDGGNFTDKNKMQKPGIMSNATGAISMLLLTVVFGGEESVFDRQRLEKANKIIESTMLDVFDRVANYGYTADPLIGKNHTSEIFFRDAEGGVKGYIDTITLVHSMTVLARYAQRNEILKFNKDTLNKNLFYLGDSLKILIDSQSENGTWGFMNDPACKNSMYFTYSVATSLADFYDYIADEISIVENRAKKPDDGVYEYLTAEYGKNFVEQIDAARSRLGNWILSCALPYLPRLSDCNNDFTREEKDLLGIWDATGAQKGLKADQYLNLYYAYQLIDMLITTSSDEAYGKIVSEKYTDDSRYKQLLKSYRQRLNANDYEYYFGSQNDPNEPDRSANFVIDYIEQATHASRFRLAMASRTGVNFWESTNSELNIKWEFNDESGASSKITNLIYKKLRNNSGELEISDPSLAPMALRANVQYIYYISGRTDLTLDKLFEMIIGDRSDKTTDDELVKGLWDTVNYNLSVTERAIEALIDYYDYLCRYEVSVPAGKSDLDIAIEKKIDAYLAEKGLGVQSSVQQDDKALERRLKAYVDGKISAISASAANYDDAAKFLADYHDMFAYLSDYIKQQNVCETGNDANGVAIFKLANLFGYLLDLYVRQIIAKNVPANTTDDAIREKLDAVSKELKELLVAMLADVDTPKYKLIALYNKLKIMFE